MKNRKLSAFILSLLILGSVMHALSQGSYKKPPKAILDVLNVPATPTTSVSPARDRIALFQPLRYPPISELAEPMLRLAGSRINPKINGQHGQSYSVGLKLKNISDGKEITVALPPGARLVSPQWSPDGKYIAVGNITANGIELWLVDTAAGKGRKVEGVMLNTAFGRFSWEDSATILATLVSSKRGQAPAYQNLTPTEPAIQETTGRAGAVQTFQDLLKNPNDERLFEYYATSQLALIDVAGRVREIGAPAIFSSFNLAPNGKYLLVDQIERPFSYLYPASRFPRRVEVWDTSGKLIAPITKSPLQDNLPVGGVSVGPRGISWVPTEPAMLMWTEALDNGDPRKKAEHRDRIMKLEAPFSAAATEVIKIEHRLQGRSFGEKDGLMLFSDNNRDTQRRRTFITDYRNPKDVRKLADLNTNDRYNDIGAPVTRTLPNGSNVILQNGDDIYLTGVGSTPEGDRPFLRRLNVKTLKTQEMFRSTLEEYESFVAFVDESAGSFITRKETVAEPANLYLRQVCPEGKVCTAMAYRPLTDFKDSAPQLRGITKQLVKYKRADGVDLSFTLYLPPGYKQGTKLPTVVWAYPLEFTDQSTAGQVSGSTSRFTQIGGYSHLFFLLEGYAVLDNTTMPIIGDPETVNDTFIKQIADSAKAAIDKGVELGVVDPDRVGVGGHSYGAFMTANLLAHTDLFRAGIARSGAYNRTLTPFGFQSERRTFWEAPDMYGKVSPFFYANKINEPILLIHGEADNNQGTFPIQSERLFAAISGTGGKARLVMLPLESHGYTARESTEHTLNEMIEWFNKYVKNAKPRSEAAAER
jgi:dipeptidyl aminopeptidase/acylaminoacyl peptidase